MIRSQHVNTAATDSESAMTAEPGVDSEDEAEELEQGALDPDEVDDPEWWDEGADDEVD